MTRARDQGLRFPFETPPEAGTAIEVAPGVLWLRQPLPMALDHVNCFALDDGDSWTIIDTGFNSAKTRAIWQAALAGPLAGKPVARVVVTHHHPDHVGLAGWFQAMGAELLIPRTAWLFARMLTLDVQNRPRPEVLVFWRAAGMTPDLLAKRATERPFNFADVVAEMPLGFTKVADGDLIRMGGRTWRVRFGHGHAPDHATFWSEDDALILGGDQLLPGISPNLGVYATEPGADPVGEWMDTCRAFQPLARADHLVLPGHKLPYTGLPLRLTQMIENHQGALTRLLDHLERPRSAVDCFSVLYKRAIGQADYGLALVEAVAHLNHLHKAGRITRQPGAEGVDLWQRTR